MARDIVLLDCRTDVNGGSTKEGLKMDDVVERTCEEVYRFVGGIGGR